MSETIVKIATAALTAAVLVSACEQKDQAPAADSANTSALPAKAKEAPVVGTLRMGPPYRPALPLKLMKSRLDTSGAGTIKLPGESEARKLAAFGVNLCSTGWVMVGYVVNEGKLEPTPPLMVNLAEIPSTAFTYEASSGGKLSLDFEEFGWQKVRGSIDVKHASGETVLAMKIDAMPIHVHNDATLASAGCYTTGYYKIGGKVGAVASVYDGADSYNSRLRLDDRHDLVIDLDVRSIGRDPKKVYRASLDRIFEKPKTFPMRVYLEKRTNKAPIDQNSTVTADHLQIDRVPITSGELVGSFVNADEKGPLRWILEDVQILDWSGPMAGEQIDTIKVDTFLATESAIVPLPRRPNWKMTIEDPEAD